MKDETALAQRVARLEYSLRRTQLVATALGVALCALVTAAAMQEPTNVREELTVKKLTTEQLVAGTATIHQMATVGTREVDGALMINGMVMVTNTRSQSVVGIQDGTIDLGGKGQVKKDGTWAAEGPHSMTTISPGKVVLAATGGTQCGLHSGAEHGALYVNDADGQPRSLLRASKEGAMFSLLDAEGRIRTELSSGRDDAAVRVLDAGGRVRAVLGTTSTTDNLQRSHLAPESTLTLYGPDGRVQAQLPR
ncbi:MAG: hypothetical protein JNL08_00985 [Planctomycetes bacterium]|nr:hypothetical protein [Planctomycetota bacterium]